MGRSTSITKSVARSFVEPLEGRRLLSGAPLVGVTPVGEPNAPVAYASSGTVVGGYSYFQVNADTATELWKTDGTDAGTGLVGSFPVGPFRFPRPVRFDIGGMTDVNGSLYFYTLDQNQPQDHVIELWTSDGATVRPVLELQPEGGGSYDRPALTTAGGKLFVSFAGADQLTTVYAIDPQNLDPQGVPEVVTVAGGLALGELNYFSGEAAYFTNLGDSGWELWKSDGTVDGTSVIDQFPATLDFGSYPLGPTFVADVNGKLLYADRKALWLHSESPEASTPLHDLPDTPWSAWSVQHRVYFITGTPIPDEGTFVNNELWVSDGTAGGTRSLGHFSGQPLLMGSVGEDMLFTAPTAGGGTEFWWTDGTPAGTRPLAELSPGAARLQTRPAPIIAESGGVAYFTSTDSNGEIKLWHSDGTVTGCTSLGDGGENGGGTQGALAVNGRLLVNRANGFFQTYEVALEPASGVVSQDLSYRLAAADPSAAQQPAAFTYNVDWNGDGLVDQTVTAGGAGTSLQHHFDTPGTYSVRISAADQDGTSEAAIYPVKISEALTIAPATTPQQLMNTLGNIAANLQQAAAASGNTSTTPIQINTTDQAGLNSVLEAIDLLRVNTASPTVAITVNASNAVYKDTEVSVPPNVVLTLDGAVFVGGSPALIVTSGTVIVANSTLTNSTDAPTILVQGGSLILRNDLIVESNAFSQVAIEVRGGTVDLGTADHPGNNVIDVRGGGTTVRNLTSTPVPAVGSTFLSDGHPIDQNLQGMVWVDFNNDGAVDFGEQGIDGVSVTVTGRNDLGNSVSVSTTTGSGGIFSFNHIRPGAYTLTEGATPTGYVQGKNSVGTLGGSPNGQDAFSNVQVGVNQNGLNYNFGEQPGPGSRVSKGQSAGIGFWNNKNGQRLIASFGSQLGNWLAATLPNTFGAFGGLSAAQVGQAFQLKFVLQDKLDAQVMATALNVYATNASLGGSAAASYGFSVSTYGLGDSTWNIGFSGAAFGVANNATLTVMQVLQDYDGLWRGDVWNVGSASLRRLALDTFGAINSKGGI